jgi:glycosyltransferase involved in cell wall biosynthesis
MSDVERIDAALERLRASSELQDLTGLRRAVALRPGSQRERVFRRAVGLLQTRRNGRDRSDLVDDLLRRTTRMLALGRKGWALPPGRLNTRLMPAFTGFVDEAAGEDQVIRLGLLLQLMKQKREAVDLLVRRFRAGGEGHQVRFWLSRWLLQAGEKKASALLASKVAARLSDETLRVRRSQPRRRHAVVMLTMFDTPVFRSSLRSLVGSDFGGRIVVVEDGYERTEVCREFCRELPVTYIKRQQWEGSAAAMNEGIAAVADDVDVVMFAHNDILWPRRWFERFDQAWDSVLDGGRVGLLNLGYLQFKHKLDSGLTELFLRGEYDHLRWVLTAAREVAALKDDRIQDSQVSGGEQMFGLARDPWNDWTPDARFMTGRFSIGASFPVEIWRDIGQFDPRLAYGFDLQLQHHCMTQRKWMLFTNNSPLIHLASSDTRSVDPVRRAGNTTIHDTLPWFEEKYGWEPSHFLNLYFSESAFIYRDEIVRAANALRFDEIDFVFDDFQERLRTRTLDNCELIWCRSRDTCKYVSPNTT